MGKRNLYCIIEAISGRGKEKDRTTTINGK